MRHRPRPALIILGLAALAVLVFIDLQGNYFFREFKARSLAMMREKIGLEGEIGSVEGGIFRGVVLKDVRLYGASPSQAKRVFFSSDAIELNYRLWDIALGKYGRLEKITFIMPKVYFLGAENRLPTVPKTFEPEWKEVAVSVKDGSFYNAQGALVVSEVNGDFKLSERGIESHNVTAGILGQRFAGKGSVGFPVERSAVKIEGLIKGQGYTLKLRLDGILDRVFVHGSFDIFDKMNLDFSGSVAKTEGGLAFNDFKFGPKAIVSGVLQTADKSFCIDLYPEDISGNATAMGEVSRFCLSGDLSKLPYFTLTVNANHLKAIGFDILSNYYISGKLNYGANDKFESVTGDFSTSGSVINYEPIREVKGAYEFKDGVIKLTGINYGDVVYANGTVGTGKEAGLDLHFKFKGAQLGGLTDLAMEKGTVSGLVFGDMDISGGVGKEMTIDGQLEFLNGNISTVLYNSAKITLRGKSSALEFIDSKVYTGDQVLMFEGRVDLRDIGTPRLFRNVVIKADQNTVVWAGANTIKAPAGEEYAAGADANEQFKVNLKTYESQQGNQVPRQATADAESKLANQSKTKLKMKENEDFFGVEHKVRF
ncbi:MAG: hypothetical protein PHR22_02285 [Candidatus Omnitrophica bacterium]|nr:hypothetical protein [Candidatus Omnitrophota bacterium]